MNKRLLSLVALIILSCTLCVMSALAVPAKRMPFFVKGVNGEDFKVVLVGDENFHYIATYADGTPVIQNENGLYELHPELKDSYTDQWAAKVKRRNATRVAKLAKTRSGAAPTQQPKSYIGKKKGLVILINFPDKSIDPQNTLDVFNDQFNKKGYDANGHIGSVSEYFYDQSYGKFSIDFDIIGPILVSKKSSYYGENDRIGDDKHVAELAAEACKLADTLVNFADYDWDGDGEVEMVYIIHAGYGEHSGASSNTIWAHEWSLQEGFDFNDGYGPIKLDNVTINTYAMSCELQGTYGNKIDCIGTACHEFSHCLGLPDIYDPNYGGAFGMSFWDLLDSGSYNGPSGKGEVPCGFTAYERWFAGWLTFNELDSPCCVKDIPDLQDEPVAYVIYNDNERNEYICIENHQSKRWFTYADYYSNLHGLLIYHIDYDETAWTDNEVNNKRRQRYSIITADGLQSDYNLQGDLFPGNSHVTQLTSISHTQVGGRFYNKNREGNYNLNKPITNIEENNGLISFSFMDGGPDYHAPSSIEKPSDDSSIQYYTLNGYRIEKPTTPGIYLVKKAGKVQKMLIGR